VCYEIGVRALWIILLAAGSLAFARAPTERPGFDPATNREAKGSSGPGEPVVVASTRLVQKLVTQARSSAIAPGTVVLAAPSRVMVAVQYRILVAPPRVVDVVARSRAPPLELVPVV
jgi:hypothetical protein